MIKLAVAAAGPFAVPMLRVLVEAFGVEQVICRPHRGRSNDPPLPVAACATELGLPLWRPETLNAPEEVGRLAALGADLLIVCDYGEILRPPALSATRWGGLNLHGSLLPKYRGAAPVQHAVWRGEAESGVSVIQMTPGLDAGPVLRQDRLAIDPDETAGELEGRLATLGAQTVLNAIKDMLAGTAAAVPQDRALATKAPRLSKEDGLIDWSLPAPAIKNQVRAMQPWPRTYTFYRSATNPSAVPLRLNIDRVQTVEPNEAAGGRAAAQPGQVLATTPDLLIATGEGALRIEQLQAANKRRMAAAEFIRGVPLRPGDLLTAES